MSAGVLWAMGVRRLHLTDFSLFFVVVLGLAAVVVATFILTVADEERRPS